MLKNSWNHLSVAFLNNKLYIALIIVVWGILVFMNGHYETMLPLLPILLILLYEWSTNSNTKPSKNMLAQDVLTMLMIAVFSAIVELLFVSLTTFIKHYSIMDIIVSIKMLIAYLPIFLIMIGVILLLQLIPVYKTCLMVLVGISVFLVMDDFYTHFLIPPTIAFRFAFYEILLDTNYILFLYMISILVLSGTYGIRYFLTKKAS